jgi:hypothetical protein
MTQQTNLLRDYKGLIDTYLDGVYVETQLNFKRTINTEDNTVTIERLLTNLPKVKLPAHTFHLDRDILSRTDVYAFSVLLYSIKRLLTTTILQFDDQFYQDRYDGLPFVDERKMEVNLQDGEGYKLLRVDEIDWKSLMKA